MDVRTICLGILTRGDATGYEIKKLFEDGRFSYFAEASFGSIYPALSRLTKDGLVSVREEAQTGRPDRKVYSITAAGRAAFIDRLRGELPEDRFRSPFLFAMMFADLVPEARLDAMIDRQIADIEARLQRLEADCSGNVRELFICGYGKTAYSAILEYLRNRRNEFKTAAASMAAE